MEYIMTTKDAARFLGCTTQHVRNLITMNKLSGVVLESEGGKKEWDLDFDSVVAYSELSFKKGRKRGIKIVKKAVNGSS